MTEITTLNPATAPQPRTPLSSVVRWDKLLFISGQVPRRADGQEEHGDIEAQTRLAMANIQALVEAGGGSLSSIVKTTVFLTDMSDLAGMNAAYAEAFGDHRPARSAFQVAALGKPEFRVEIEAIAVVD